MKRLFAAINIDASARFTEILQSISRELRHERIKWVEPGNIHITLKFFGETDETRIPAIRTALGEAAGMSQGFTMNIRRTGIFGSRYDPRVIWFGIDREPSLELLAANTVRALSKAGWEPDRQNFVPHLTIGRIRELKDKNLFQQVIDTYRDASIQQQQVREIILYESILRKEGPLYLKLAAFPLR